MKDTQEHDRITAELRAAAERPAARFWHIAEEVVVVAIVLLMALRPL